MQTTSKHRLVDCCILEETATAIILFSTIRTVENEFGHKADNFSFKFCRNAVFFCAIIMKMRKFSCFLDSFIRKVLAFFIVFLADYQFSLFSFKFSGN